MLLAYERNSPEFEKGNRLIAKFGCVHFSRDANPMMARTSIRGAFALLRAMLNGFWRWRVYRFGYRERRTT